MYLQLNICCLNKSELYHSQSCIVVILQSGYLYISFIFYVTFCKFCEYGGGGGDFSEGEALTSVLLIIVSI